MDNEKVVVALIETTDEGISLMATREHNVHGFESKREGLDHFELGYKRCHGLSYEMSMSACLNYMQFRPSIVEFESFEDLVDKLLGKSTQVTFISMSSISGHMICVKLSDQEIARKYWDEGLKPNLI